MTHWVRTFTIFAYLVCAILPFILHAQERSERTDSTENYFIAIPIVFRTPETSWGFGAGAAYNFYWKNDRVGDRPSQLQLGAVYTLEKQWLFYLPYQLYFQNGKYNFNGELGYYYYFFRYYGIGNNTHADAEEFYLAEFPRFKWEGLYALSEYVFAGLTYDYDNFQILENEEGGILDNNQPIAYRGGVISEIGIIAYWDSRDNIFYPESGAFIQYDLYWGSELLSSASEYWGMKINASKYYQLPWKHVIAGQILWESQYGKVPFFQLGKLGGPKLLRGYIEGRFRDRHLSLFQFAYRFPLVWRFKMEVFGGYGVVDDQISVPLINGHWSYGAGLRFLADKENRLHLRLDVALGSDQTGFYLTVGEAF